MKNQALTPNLFALSACVLVYFLQEVQCKNFLYVFNWSRAVCFSDCYIQATQAVLKTTKTITETTTSLKPQGCLPPIIVFNKLLFN